MLTMQRKSKCLKAQNNIREPFPFQIVHIKADKWGYNISIIFVYLQQNDAHTFIQVILWILLFQSSDDVYAKCTKEESDHKVLHKDYKHQKCSQLKIHTHNKNTNVVGWLQKWLYSKPSGGYQSSCWRKSYSCKDQCLWLNWALSGWYWLPSSHDKTTQNRPSTRDV